MLKLDLPKEPYWLTLPAQVELFVKPLSSALMQAAQAQAVKELLALRELREQLQETGQDVTHLPDITDQDIRHSLSEIALTKALARLAILQWKGVLAQDSDELAPITLETVNHLMDFWFIAQEFYRQYHNSLTLLEREGNDSRPAANGTSAAGHATASTALTTISPAAEESEAP
ncbi:MAG: hypothetical protein DI582_10655 [Azospirillum brasilense]|nr:MAG: hypothetical protein DI582_10655 [Azospirillum brasilense]